MTDVICNQFATAAIKERRATIAGELAQLESQATFKREALTHLDAVLRMFAPDLDPGAIPAHRQRRANPYPIVGLTRRIRDILRRRGEPLSTHDVIDALVAEMAYPDDACRAIAPSVRCALRDLGNSDASILKEGVRAEAMWSLKQA